jgi:2-keto-3-deoxy-L-fuconate dehydrogenase
MSLFDLSGKTVIITGGGSGIGKGISLLFGQQGAQVYILEMNLDAATETVAAITEKGGKATYLRCDVSAQKEVIKTMQTIKEESGKIDILINNAGVAHIGNVEQTAEEDLDRIYNINVKGVYNCIYACIPFMKEAEGGVILNMASVAAMLGIPDRFAYSMSKGATLTMTYSVAKDYLKDNIRCNCISPARIHTPFVDGYLKKNYPGQEQEIFEKLAQTQPIGRMGKPVEVAALALYLCSDEASFITGTNYPIDGGFVNLNT